MSEAVIDSTYEQMPMVHNGACADQKQPVSPATAGFVSTSIMVHPATQPSPDLAAHAATADQSSSNDSAANGAEAPDVMHLSPKMTQAIDLLFAGHSAVSVANQMGVHRNTIARWRGSHAAFIAAYNRRRSEAADDLTRRITGILEAAIANVERHITTSKKPNPDQIRASLRLISSLSRSRRIFATGPTDPFAVLDQMIRYDRYLSDKNVHTFIDDKTRASYIGRYTERLANQAADFDLPHAPPKRIHTGHPTELPTHPWDKKKPARTKDPLA